MYFTSKIIYKIIYAIKLIVIMHEHVYMCTYLNCCFGRIKLSISGEWQHFYFKVFIYIKDVYLFSHINT